MAIEHKLVESKDEWESFISTRAEANFLHSWNWAVFNRALDKQVFCVGYSDGDKLVGAMLAVVEEAKRGRYLAVAAGPIIDWTNQQLVNQVVVSLQDLAQQTSSVFARVRPQLVSSEESKSLFLKMGFKPAQMHLEAELTLQLDITKELDEIRNNMRKNTRYELKQAKKKEISVSSSNNPQDVKEFYELQLATAQRHGFVPFAYERLFEQFKAFAEDDQVLLYSAKTKAGDLIAQAMVMFYGAEASYHYGASTELGRKEPGAYLIQWKAIQEAKQRGCSRYNFWGVVGEDEKSHRFYGVSVFKRGFRGEDVEYLHAHDLVFSKAKYLKNYAIEYARKRKRKV